ncbi:CKLF-like MARVEL transmembrane domain-containing protein 6 [Stigmatopora nigra]
MAQDEVYSSTTMPEPNAGCCRVPSEYLDKVRFAVKLLEVLLSMMAFILEEVVSVCNYCTALDFFELASCTSFLFTALLLILLSTKLHDKVGIECWSKMDFVYTLIMALLFLIASIVFAARNNDSRLEKSAVAFGFLATLAFAFDLFLFWKTYGLPFSRGARPPPGNYVDNIDDGDEVRPSDVEAPAETDKFNTDAGTAE